MDLQMRPHPLRSAHTALCWGNRRSQWLSRRGSKLLLLLILTMLSESVVTTSGVQQGSCETCKHPRHRICHSLLALFAVHARQNAAQVRTLLRITGGPASAHMSYQQGGYNYGQVNLQVCCMLLFDNAQFACHTYQQP